MPTVDSRVSNAMGVPIPLWIVRQLERRSRELKADSKNTENVLFRGNRSAFVRMVSSVNVNSFEKEKYFRDNFDIGNSKGSELAKKFVLQGGVSKYQNSGVQGSGFRLVPRSGISDAYNVAGPDEIRNYGYRPMPGITSVRVQTQGKLGSIRAAEIQIRVWDKLQLDIIDSLYFRLGFTMFLEWGHTNYYKENNNTLQWGEDISVDPFQEGLVKEDIYNLISKNVRDSEGNYDAMLGMVTNFNFSYNQEGGYDCTIKLISLGVLASSIKVNNPKVLPGLRDLVIKKLFNTLEKLNQQKLENDRRLNEQQNASQDPNAKSEEAYPPCVRGRGKEITIDTKKTQRLEDTAIQATINNVNYLFYKSKKYQTSGFSLTGNYDCQGNEILIDGVNENLVKKTYQQIVEGNKKSIGYTFAPYTNPQYMVLTDGGQVDRFRGVEYLDSPFVFSVEISDNEYLAINKLKQVVPIDDITDYNVEASLKFPTFVINEPVQTPILIASVSQNQFTTFQSPEQRRASLNTTIVTKSSKNLLLLPRPIKQSFQSNNAISELYYGNEVSISGIIRKGSPYVFTTATNKYDQQYQSYIKYKNSATRGGITEIHDYFILLSYSAEAKSADDRRKNTLSEVISNESDEYKINELVKQSVGDNKIPLKLVDIGTSRNNESQFIGADKRIPKIFFTFEKEVSISFTIQVKTGVIDNPATPEKEKIPVFEPKQVEFKIRIQLDTNDPGLIDGIKINKDLGFTVVDALSIAKQQESQNTQQISDQTVEVKITAEDIQKTEAAKYQSAFEVMIRTLQLYSLDKALESGIQNEGSIVQELALLDGANYKSFTEPLFSTGMFSKLMPLISGSVRNTEKIGKLCEAYDSEMQQNGKIEKKEDMLAVRALFGFQFALMGNNATAMDLYNANAFVSYDYLMSTYTVPYRFNVGVFESTQVNHPVYVSLGLVIMIINHICSIYDSKKSKESSKGTEVETPLVYFDFNNKTNLCLSLPEQLTTNPYDVLIPFQGSNKDFERILEPTTLGYNKNGVAFIKPVSGSQEGTRVYTPRGEGDLAQDKLSGNIPNFKILLEDVDTYRGRTMNVLLSCDYLLRVVASYSKNNGSGDIYAREFIEQILFDINKSIGDVNVFRLAYDDSGNTLHVVDDQMLPNLEKDYIGPDPENKRELPVFGAGSIAKNLEIRTEISSKLGNMIAISANSDRSDQASLSKNSDSYGIYNFGLEDRYIPSRTESTSSVALPTDPMVNSTIQFNEAIKTFYSDPNPAQNVVSHVTNYYIQRMSKIKNEQAGSKAATLIPVNLNFSIDGVSGLAMGQAFTIPPEILPYNYTNLYDDMGQLDKLHEVGFVTVGLDQVIENNQWTSNARASMIFLKKVGDYSGNKLDRVKRNVSGFFSTNKSVNSPDTISGCKRVRGELDEQLVSSTTLLDINNRPVKGKVSFISALENADKLIKAQGLKLEIADSYRTYETQRTAYEEYLKNVELQKQGREWIKNGQRNSPSVVPDRIAEPCSGYHVRGQAIDLAQTQKQKDDILSEGPIYKAMYAQGLRRISNEWWHWSIGEVS